EPQNKMTAPGDRRKRRHPGAVVNRHGPLTIRLPRVLLALRVGAALALSGCVLQGLFRNPLADPGLLGIRSGAALAVAS
ncbi:iron chelate uptake ABC transporter family permease subunit, partial [Klebsiella pneumoniae]|uniref:iron chelate uptake ABC transporter family permease subunit n=1 Tax=Klebsiella pneumoniae TaxID=573 RepID=UPI00351E51EB